MSTHYENHISSPIIGPKSKRSRNCENADKNLRKLSSGCEFWSKENSYLFQLFFKEYKQPTLNAKSLDYFDPAFWEKGGAWAKIEVYFARYPK